MRQRKMVVATVVALVFTVFVTASAQQTRTRKTAKAKILDVARAVEKTRGGYSEASPQILARVNAAYSQPRGLVKDNGLPGTWYVNVDDGGFHAFQTFGSDGIFVETSSLLGSLVEGPAHGIWEPRKRGAVLTFQVFEFDPDGNEAGRVRVRTSIKFVDDNHIFVEYVVDFIDLNGDIVEGIATGTYTGERFELRSL